MEKHLGILNKNPDVSLNRNGEEINMLVCMLFMGIGRLVIWRTNDSPLPEILHSLHLLTISSVWKVNSISNGQLLDFVLSKLLVTNLLIGYTHVHNCSAQISIDFTPYKQP